MSREARNKEINMALLHLEVAWKRVPDQRLGQLIVNALPLHYQYSTFYIPDDELVQALKHYGARFER